MILCTLLVVRWTVFDIRRVRNSQARSQEKWRKHLSEWKNSFVVRGWSRNFHRGGASQGVWSTIAPRGSLGMKWKKSGKLNFNILLQKSFMMQCF